MGGGDYSKLIKSLETYKNKTYKVVPYYSQDSKTIVPYYVSDTAYGNLKSGKNVHGETNSCYVKGDWYISSNLNGKKDGLNGVYMTSVNDALKEAKESGSNIEQAMKAHGWIKLK